MGIRKQIFPSLALLLFCAAASAQIVTTEEAQPEGLMEIRIDEALRNAPFRAGVFHIRPAFNIYGEYDSNGLSLPDGSDPQEDYNLQATPAVTAVLPFKSRGLLEIYEQVNFIYYKELEDLRGVFDVTSARFTTGGSRMLFTVGDEFHSERVRPTLEFDFPTDERRNRFDASLTTRLGERSEFGLGLISSSSTILDDIVNPEGIPLSQFYDRRETRVFVGTKRYISSRTAFVADFYYEDLNFAEQSVQPDADIYVLQGGFSFEARGNITGEALLGYKRMLPDLEGEEEYSGLVGSGSVSLRVGERTTLGIIYSRDARPSVTDTNWFFIENRVAPSIEHYVTRPLSIYAQVAYGKNSYSLPGTVVNSEGELVVGEIKDDSLSASLAMRYKIRSYWQVFVSGSTFSRDSNLQDSEKQRYLISAGMSTYF